MGDGTATYQDLWEWDQTLNSWPQKTSLPGQLREGAQGFSIGTKGYVGTGFNGAYLNDFWEWDQASNTWTQKASYGGTTSYAGGGFAIGTKGYIGFGWDGTGLHRDFWEWTSSNVGINENHISEYSVSVYPNPVISSATIEIENYPNPDFDFVAYDATGREVKKVEGIKTSTFSFERESLKSGMYLYSLRDRNSKEIIGQGKIFIN